MRHADQPTVDVDVYVEAPPELIWPLVTDIGLLVATSDELTAAEWEQGGGAALGRRFVGTNCNEYFGEWQTTCTVIECDRPRAFAWAVGEVDEPNTTWRFSLRGEGSGTVLTQWMRLGTGPSGMTVAIETQPDKEERIIERRLQQFRAAMQANVDAIKVLAERAAS